MKNTAIIDANSLNRIICESINEFFFNDVPDKEEIEARKLGYHSDGTPLDDSEIEADKEEDMDALWSEYGNLNRLDQPYKDDNINLGMEAQHRHNTPIRKMARVGGIESSTNKAHFDAYYDALRKERNKKH